MNTISENLTKIEEVIAQGPFEVSWYSLEGYVVPAWYEDAKFGHKYFIPMFKVEKWDPEQLACSSIVDPIKRYEMLVFEQD